MCLTIPALALGAFEHHQLCRDALGDGWTSLVDQEKQSLVETLVRRADLTLSVVLCKGATSNRLDIASSARHKAALVLGLHIRLEALVGGDTCPVVAHEVAHAALGNDGICQHDAEHVAEHIECEHRVDRLAAEWVGKVSMLRTLEIIASLFEKEYPDDRTVSSAASILRRRIDLLNNEQPH